MGIHDRGYYREEQRSAWLGNRSMVFNLIVLNVAIFLADHVFDYRISEELGLKSDLLRAPWQFWQLLTYGFVHDPQSIMHVGLNMFGVWLFGTDVEQIYGRVEFLRIYVSTIIVAGLIWAAVETGTGGQSELVGASGGVMGLMIIYVLHFPQRTFYIYGILPLKAWALGALYVVGDLMGAAQNTDNVAHLAHLSGMAYGFVYYRSGWNLGRLIPQRISGSMFKLRPPLRIHDPGSPGRDLNEQVDQILEKISREGESSLTKKERRTLEEASRRYQRRRQ
ncbi:MAG: rhomboid family intramembrane serine protease [Planctomycetia bacterium]|nr:rhomboid family intramembrane serine protease [Planctomycetia bacterium]